MYNVRLPSYPAFGFEHTDYNANDARVKPDALSAAHLLNCIFDMETSATICMIAADIFKVLGAFNPLVGAARLADVLIDSNQEDAGWKAFRGVVELGGLGWMCVIADIACTLFNLADEGILQQDAILEDLAEVSK